MDKSSGNKDRTPMAIPIHKGDAPILTIQSGTKIDDMGTMDRLKKAVP